MWVYATFILNNMNVWWTNVDNKHGMHNGTDIHSSFKYPDLPGTLNCRVASGDFVLSDTFYSSPRILVLCIIKLKCIGYDYPKQMVTNFENTMTGR